MFTIPFARKVNKDHFTNYKMTPKQEDGKRYMLENEKSEEYTLPVDESRDLLHQMKPILKSMEEAGSILDTIMEAFQGDEGLLLEKIRPALPAKWIKAPDQTMMLKYNWYCPNAFDRKLDFKDNQIRLGRFLNDKLDQRRRQRGVFVDRCRVINNSDLSASRDRVSYTIKGAGCPCCGGNEEHEFTLFFNPRRMKYKLLVQETVTAYCCSSDNIEQVYDEYDFVAYMRHDETKPLTENGSDNSDTGACRYCNKP